MKYTISILMLLILSVGASAQLEINFESADTMPTPGSSINVDVTVGNFVDIVNLQYWIYWDSTVLAFDTITNLNTDINMDLDGFNYPGNPITVAGMMTQYPDGKIGVSWQDGINTQTLDDGEVLFTITLDAVGMDCDSTMMTIGDNPPFGEIEVYTNFDFSPAGNIGAVSDGANFMIPGDCGDIVDPECEFTYVLSQEQGEENGTVCVFLSVEDFVNIESFQGGIYFDETIIEYDGFDFLLDTEFEGVSLVGDGVLSFLAVVDDITVADGTQVLKLNFNVLGDIGEMTDLTMGDAGNVIMEVKSTTDFLEICIDDGKVTVVDEIIDTITLNLLDQSVDDNSNFCFPLVVTNFTDITTLQFAIQWDDVIFTYTGVQNLNTDIQIVDGSHINVNDDGNTCNVSWTSSTGGGMTLPDGSVLFEKCFDVDANCINEDPITATLSIVGNPDIEIAAEANGGIVVVPFTTSDSNVTIICGDLVPCESTIINIAGETADAGCVGAATGSIIATPSGGMAPYDCTWTNSAGEVIQSNGNCNIQNLTAGTYTVDVVDANTCTGSQTFTIDEPTVAIDITATSTPASCTTGGAIATSVTNSVGTLTYIWSSPDLSGPNPMNVPVGNISVVVTDGNGCTASTSVMVGSSSEVTVAGSSTDASCNGGGTITPTYTGGSGNYSYCWSDLPVTGPFNLDTRVGLNAGTYTITVKDGDTGCSDSATFTIANTITPLNVTAGNTTDIGCESDTGSFTYTVSGGCPTNGTYQCSLDGGAATNCTGVVTGLTAGSHTLVITDNSNPAQSETLNFTISGSVETLTIIGGGNLQTTNPLCNGDQTGSLDGVNISGGCPDADGEYTCTVQGMTVPCSEVDDILVVAGTYILTVSDGDNQDTAEFTITEPDPVVITEETVTISDVTCASAIDVSVAGGSDSYIYTWTYNGDAFADTEDIADLCPGEYCLEVVDTNGCPASGGAYCMTVTSPVEIDSVLIISTLDNSGFGVSCLGECDAVISGVQTSGGMIAFIQLTDTDGNNQEHLGFPIDSICAGTYSMTVTDIFGGVYTHPDFIVVTEPTQLDADVDNIIDASNGMDNGAISLVVDGGAGGYEYEWNPGDCVGITCTGLAPGFYTVNVTDTNGCSAIVVDMEVGTEGDERVCYEGTSVITPNGDEVNDLFMISCLDNDDLEGHSLAIFDRWGRLILDTDNYDNLWGGTDMDGSLLQEGGYYYVFTGDFANGEQRIFKGSVTLLRD